MMRIKKEFCMREKMKEIQGKGDDVKFLFLFMKLTLQKFDFHELKKFCQFAQTKLIKIYFKVFSSTLTGLKKKRGKFNIKFPR